MRVWILINEKNNLKAYSSAADADWCGRLVGGDYKVMELTVQSPSADAVTYNVVNDKLVAAIGDKRLPSKPVVYAGALYPSQQQLAAALEVTTSAVSSAVIREKQINGHTPRLATPADLRLI